MQKKNPKSQHFISKLGHSAEKTNAENVSAFAIRDGVNYLNLCSS